MISRRRNSNTRNKGTRATVIQMTKVMNKRAVTMILKRNLVAVLRL
jgi:hypothetical protein